MPAIGQGSGKSAAAEHRVRRHKSAAPRRAAPKPYVPSPTQLRSAHAQERQYRSQGHAVKRAASQQRVAAAKQRLSTPRAYTHDVGVPSKAAERFKKTDAYVRAIHAAAREGYRSGTKSQREAIFGRNLRPTASQRASLARQEHLGLGGTGGLYGNAFRDVIDMTEHAPASVYMLGHAGVKAAEGHPAELKSLAKSFVHTDPIALAVQGKFGKALHAAYTHPVSTALELSGGEGAVGRIAGAVGRKGLLGSRVARAASLERAPLRAYDLPHAPATGRTYNRDVFRKAGQVIRERHAAGQGRAPDVYRPSALKRRGTPMMRRANAGLAKHPLDARVDQMIHAHRLMKMRHVAEATKKAAKAAPRIIEEAAAKRRVAEVAREEPKVIIHARRAHENPEATGPLGAGQAAAKAVAATRYFREHGKLPDWAKAEPERRSVKSISESMPQHERMPNVAAVAAHAHDVLGLKHPVRIEPMPERLRSAGRHGGHDAQMAVDARGNPIHQIYIDPRLGEGARSFATHFELGRAQAAERGLGTERGTTHMTPEEYAAHPSTVHAKAVAAEHMDKNLFESPAARPALPHQAHEDLPAVPTTEEIVNRAAQHAHASVLRAHFAQAVREFGHKLTTAEAGKYETAKAAADHLTEVSGEPMIPVDVRRLMRVNTKVHVPSSMADRPLDYRAKLAWEEAVKPRGGGRTHYVVMPERAIGRFMEHAAVSLKGTGDLGRIGTHFKDTVLTATNPFHWLSANAGDLAMRTALEGLTPADFVRGAHAYLALGKQGLRGQMVRVNLTGSGIGHVAREGTAELGETAKHPFGMPGRAWDASLGKAWHAYRKAIYGIESAMEATPQIATVGKVMRRDPEFHRTLRSLKGALFATDEQIQHFVRHLTTDPTFERQAAEHVHDVIGSWGKLSPSARSHIVAAPFAQWLGAATRYVLVTLPTKHPIKMGILAGMQHMTEEERKRLGLSEYLPHGKQLQEYQQSIIPTKIGRNKYGPTVRGPNLATALSFGTARQALGLDVQGFLLPQFSAALNMAHGVTFYGEQMTYPEGDPRAGESLSVQDKVLAAMGGLIESLVPFVALGRKLIAGGRDEQPSSSILAIHERDKYVKGVKQPPAKGSALTALGKWAGSPAKLQTGYTNEAERNIRDNPAAFRAIHRMNAKRKKRSGGVIDFSGASAGGASAPSGGSGGVIDFSGAGGK